MQGSLPSLSCFVLYFDNYSLDINYVCCFAMRCQPGFVCSISGTAWAEEGFLPLPEFSLGVWQPSSRVSL